MNKLNFPKISIRYVVGVDISCSATTLTHELGRQSDITKDGVSIDGVQTDKSGKKGFFLSGGSVDDVSGEVSGCLMDGTYTFFDDVEKYHGVIGNVLSGNDYTFASEQSITVARAHTGDYITAIAIYFDDIAGEHATNIVFSTEPGTVYKNNNSVFVKSFGRDSTVTSVKISFTKWSKKNSLAKVLKVVTTISGEYDYRTIKSIAFSDEKISNEEDVSFGVTSQFCDFSLIDKNGLIKALHATNILMDDAVANIYLVNTVEKDIYDPVTGQTGRGFVDTEDKIGEFYLSTYENERGTTNWDFSLVDKLEKFKEETIAPEEVARRTLYDIVSVILGRMGFSEDIIEWEPNARAFCRAKVIPTSYIEPNQYAYDVLCKCCEVGLLRVFINPQGKVRVERGL